MSIFSDIEPIRFAGPDTDNEYAYRCMTRTASCWGRAWRSG